MTERGELDAVDAELLARFERQGFSRAEWTHEMHVRIGWIHLRRWGFDEAMDRVRAGIVRLNESNGVVNDDHGGYHETITRGWLMLIAGLGSAAATSAGFVEAERERLGADALLAFYSRERLGSVEARRGWVEGDVWKTLG